jgi:arsenate reductase
MPHDPASPLRLHGIPTCGTVKKARQWLDAQGIAYHYVDLRETPPTAEEVAAWVAKVGAQALKNTSGGSYRALGPKKDAYQEADWQAAFAGDPMLIKRPVLVGPSGLLAVGFSETTWAKLGLRP